MTGQPRLINQWYPHYFAQTWYANTFLVNDATQISRTLPPDAEWNNIYDSGCHFTCLAMILGIDPARLASVLGRTSFFLEDSSLPARHLDGTAGSLVWDQNAPHETLDCVSVEDCWHQTLGRRISFSLHYCDSGWARNYKEARPKIQSILDRGNHVVCGPEDHSVLVAGETSDDYLYWDPDGESTTVEENIEGNLLLNTLFTQNRKKVIEIWEYQALIR